MDMERFEVAMAAQQRTELRMEALAEAQQHTKAVVAQLAAQQARMQITQDKHTGYLLEGVTVPSRMPTWDGCYAARGPCPSRNWKMPWSVT